MWQSTLLKFLLVVFLAILSYAEPAPLPQFELLFSGPLLVGEFNPVSGLLGTRLSAPIVGGKVSDAAGKFAATIIPGPGVEHGVVAANGTFFPDARLTFQWAVDQKFAYIDAIGVGIAGVGDMFYTRLETDSPTWDYLNNRFIIANLTFGEPTPILTFFGIKMDNSSLDASTALNDTEVFQNMISLPIAEGEIADGSSDEQPLVLQGIEDDGFAQLLRVMSPDYDSEESLALNQWISVLNISTMWRFDHVRAIAIRKLSAMVDEPIQRLVLAKTYHVTEWLVPALNALAQRAEPLQPADVEQIGVDYAVNIAAVRESFGETTQCWYQSYSCYDGHRNDCGRPAASRGDTDFSAEIRAVFGAEVLP